MKHRISKKIFKDGLILTSLISLVTGVVYPYPYNFILTVIYVLFLSFSLHPYFDKR